MNDFYINNNYNTFLFPGHCLASRWNELSQMMSCKRDIIAAHHYQQLFNFTTVENTLDTSYDYGKAIDSTNSRALYCD
jgi:hypothetical protein